MTLANRVTFIRFFLVPLFIASLVYYRVEIDLLRVLAIVLFSLAMVTDAIDGYLARRFSQKSALGVILDPLADKFLLVSGFLALTLLENIPESFQIPPWLTILVMSRDIFILSGALVMYLVTQHLDVQPSLLGKITTFLQMTTILLTLLNLPVRGWCYVLTACFTFFSGLGYLRYGVSVLNGTNAT